MNGNANLGAHGAAALRDAIHRVSPGLDHLALASLVSEIGRVVLPLVANEHRDRVSRMRIGIDRREHERRLLVADLVAARATIRWYAATLEGPEGDRARREVRAFRPT